MSAINYIANRTFAQIHRDTNKHIFVRGPVGSGKSSGCVMHILMNAMKQMPDRKGVRRSRYVVIRATYPAIETTILKTWREWFQDSIKIRMGYPIQAIVKLPQMPDGTSVEMEVYFMGMEDINAAQKLRSMELTGAHINEASEIPYEVFELLSSRIPRFPSRKEGLCAVDPVIILDYNAIPTNHWLYRYAEEIKPENEFSFYVQPAGVLKVDATKYPDAPRDLEGNAYIMNPEADNIEFLDPTYYAGNIWGKDPEFISVNLMNNYGDVRQGRPVYKDYDDMHHVTASDITPLSGIPIIIGIDQGLTPAAVFTQQAPDGKILVFDEITTDDCSLQEFCNDLLWPKINNEYYQHRRNITLIVDPATKQRSMNDAKAGTDIIKEAGFKYRVAKTNVATERREAVVNFLRKKDGFKLSPKCTQLRRGFISGYKYDEVRASQSGVFKDTPAKNEYSHPHDALQYAMLEYYNPRPKRSAPVMRRSYQAASSIGGY